MLQCVEVVDDKCCQTMKRVHWELTVQTVVAECLVPVDRVLASAVLALFAEMGIVLG